MNLHPPSDPSPRGTPPEGSPSPREPPSEGGDSGFVILLKVFPASTNSHITTRRPGFNRNLLPCPERCSFISDFAILKKLIYGVSVKACVARSASKRGSRCTEIIIFLFFLADDLLLGCRKNIGLISCS